MKLITGILGCALAAGLMTFAPDKAHAAVIGGTLYSPLKLKLTAHYVDAKGKNAKMNITSKDVLTGLLNDTTKGDELAVSSSGDVWIINKDTLVADISQAPNDYLFINYGSFVSSTSGKDGNKYEETGVTYVNFYDGGYAAAGTGSANWFETTGDYAYSETTGKTDKNGDFKFSQSYKAKKLAGQGCFAGLSADTLELSGSASYKGSGKITASGAQASVVLGAAANFAVLAGSTVANTGLTTVTGDLGLSPGSDVAGFPPGIVTGNQHVADTTSAQAELDLTTAYNDAAGRTVAPVSVAGNIGGMTLAPGLYKSTASLEISSGDLTLDAQGDTNAVFIFQIASTLTTTSGRQVILAGGAKAANIFWQVGTSATLGTTSVFKGTIMADQSITLNTGAELEGRALARIAAVTLSGNVITIPAP